MNKLIQTRISRLLPLTRTEPPERLFELRDADGVCAEPRCLGPRTHVRLLSNTFPCCQLRCYLAPPFRVVTLLGAVHLKHTPLRNLRQ